MASEIRLYGVGMVPQITNLGLCWGGWAALLGLRLFASAGWLTEN
jgi:hypothetical protein